MSSLIIIAGCVIKKDGKYLLVQEKKPSAYGLWNLPAGHIDAGETHEQAALREAKEETGYDVVIEKSLPIIKQAAGEEGKSYEFHHYVAQVIAGTLTFPKNELLDAGWKSYDEIAALHDEGKLRAECVFQSITALEKP